MSTRRQVLTTYVRIWRTYQGWMFSILALALVVFLPLALLDALTANVEVDALDLTSGIKIAALGQLVRNAG